VYKRQHRFGIGSAHIEAIAYGIKEGYDFLVTLDADGTHSVSDVHRMLEVAARFDLVIGSRFISKNSLQGWSLIRKILTRSAHVVTKIGLGLPHDCSSGLRCYNLKSGKFMKLVDMKESGYDFFFKSVFLLSKQNISIHNMPVILQARSHGDSKLDFFSGLRSISKLLFTITYFRASELLRHFRLK